MMRHLVNFAFNVLLGSIITIAFTPGLNLNDSILKPTSLIIAVIFFVIDLSLPAFYRMLQLLMPVILSHIVSRNGPNTDAYMGLVLLILIAIKAYALKLTVGKVRASFSKKKIAHPINIESFYSSSAWRNLRYQVLVEDGRVCVACGENRVYNEKGARIRYHVDHIKPRSLYPELALSRKNMQVMCECCNLGKSNKWEIDHRLAA